MTLKLEIPIFLLPIEWRFDENFGSFYEVVQENSPKFLLNRIFKFEQFSQVLASKLQRLNVKRVPINQFLSLTSPDLFSK